MLSSKMRRYEDFIIDPLEAKTVLISDVEVNEIKPYINNKDKLIEYTFDRNRFDHLQKIKDIYKVKDPKLTRHVYPYENVNNSIFNNRAALKLANLDLIFDLTGFRRDLFYPHVEGKKVYADLAFAPGGFTQYLQFRSKNSFVYGITYKEELSWKEEDIDMTRFENVQGGSKTGNLLIDYKDFIDRAGKVDLVVADGGTEIKESKDKEILSARLILAEIYIGIFCTKSDFIVKVFDTITKTSADIIYLCSLFFERIYLFKPIMSRSTNAEKYLICKNRNSYNDPEIMIKLHQLIDRNKEVIIFDKLPANFVNWLTEVNNFYIEKQIAITENFTDLYNKKFVKKIKANLHAVLIELYLPGERFKGYEKRPIKRNF